MYYPHNRANYNAFILGYRTYQGRVSRLSQNIEHLVALDYHREKTSKVGGRHCVVKGFMEYFVDPHLSWWFQAASPDAFPKSRN